MSNTMNFELNEKLLNLESEIVRLKEVISNYEEKCRDMELDNMIEDGGELSDMDGEREVIYAEDKMAHDLHDYIAATHRMNQYFEDKLETLSKEKINEQEKTA